MRIAPMTQADLRDGARLGGGRGVEPGTGRRGGVPGGGSGRLPDGLGRRRAGRLHLGGAAQRRLRVPRALHLPAGVPGPGAGVADVAGGDGAVRHAHHRARRGGGAAGQLPPVGVRPGAADRPVSRAFAGRRGFGGRGCGGGSDAAGAAGARPRGERRGAARVPAALVHRHAGPAHARAPGRAAGSPAWARSGRAARAPRWGRWSPGAKRRRRGCSTRLAGLYPGAEVSLDVPETNPAATALAARKGLRPVFETARMYRGAAPVERRRPGSARRRWSWARRGRRP